MGDNLAVEGLEDSIPAPPKFDLEDLPPPPDFSDMPKSKLPKPKVETIEKKEEPKANLKKQFENKIEENQDTKNTIDTLSLEPIVKKENKPFINVFSKIFKKKDIKEKPVKELPTEANIPDFNTPPMPEWVTEGETFKENEMELEGEEFVDSEMPMPLPIPSSEQKTKTPLTEIKGIGPAIEKKLKKAGIKTVEHLAEHHHDHVAEKANIPVNHAKKIISYAKKISANKQKYLQSDSISDIVKSLEEEKKALSEATKSSKDKIIDLEGHKEVIEVLEKLGDKKTELLNMQKNLETKQIELQTQDHTYRRDMEYVDNLKRNLDHDVRERTQYLIQLEKEYFQKAQTLAREKAELEVLSKKLGENEKEMKEKETNLKNDLNELEDREITIETKEKKFEKMMEEIDKHNAIIKEKEDDLEKRETDYMKKLDILENHESEILKNLEQKRNNLEKKEKEIKLKEERLEKKQRNVDKKTVAFEYAKDIIEEEKGKLIDEEYHQYVHDQVNKPGTGVNYSDVALVNNLKVPDLDNRDKSIYQLIEKTEDMLKNNRVGEAKVYYNQLRERYYDTKFLNRDEQEKVHNIIRTLYDEINLADIGRN